MGSIVGKAMEESMVKQQQMMRDMQEITLQRQLQMQNLMRERMMAAQIARSRDLCYWFGTFYTFAAIGSIVGFKQSKKPAALAPLLPLTFIFGYQIDMAFGSKLQRIRDEAEHILLDESSMVLMPKGIPTLEEIDSRRLQK